MALKMEPLEEFMLLTIDRPQALNALSFALLQDLGQHFDQMAKSKARALIITGAGDKAFCAGADIGELMNRDRQAQKHGAELGQSVFAKLDKLAVPSLALINGFAFGGGLELALACTFRLATPNAKMGLPEIKLGLIPGYGGTQRLPRAIGQTRANEMILTGMTIDSAKALDFGLINQVVSTEKKIEEAIAFCRRFSGYSLPALSYARSAILRAHDLPLSEGLQVEADLSTLAYSQQDADEGMRAFSEKRPAVFKDQ